MKLQKLLAGSGMAVLASFALVGVVGAAAVNSNGSFENGTAPGVFTSLAAVDNTTINNWTVTSGSVDYIGTYWASADGARSLDMTGSDGNAGAVSQVFPTVAGHTYTVSFNIAGNPDGGPVVKSLDVDAGGASTLYTFDTTGKTTTDMGWSPRTYVFTASGPNTTLSFTSLNPGFFGPALDNVVVTDVLTNKDQCKNDGWKAYTDPSFKNQGDCVSYIQSNPHAVANKLN